MILEIPGDPIAKKRPRFRRVGMGVRTYSDQVDEEAEWKQRVADQVMRKLKCALYIHCLFVMRRPQNHWGTGRNAGQLKDNAPYYYVKKRKDIDNLIKFVLDGLNGIAYKDDCQVAHLEAVQRYQKADEGAYTKIEVKALE